MQNQRIEQLIQFLKDDPNDPFTIYALALEYLKTDDNKALVYFNQLLNEHPDYIATYYHAGKLFEKLGNKEKAGEVYQKGIQLATQTRKLHALNELRAAYNILMDEEEDW
ncbi:MAG TPA: tetratricopeptide repeat protein [Cytophagaceae bacterium]